MAVVSGRPVSFSANECSVKSAGAEMAADDVLLEELSTRFRGVLPVQPTPILIPPDSSQAPLETVLLNGIKIYCFNIGGELRLCFPQVISVVLENYDPNLVTGLFSDLEMYLTVANPQQLEILKAHGVMPLSSDSCGLVTRSDAERLVAKLVPMSSGPLASNVPRDDALPVEHDCFGGCKGLLIPRAASEECIECSECKYMFKGEKFIKHSHSTEQIRRLCHWGFNPANWKHYLYLPEELEDDIKAIQRLHLYKYPHIRLGKRSADIECFQSGDEMYAKAANLATTAAPMQSFLLLPDLQNAAMLPVSNLGFAAAASALNPQLQSLLSVQLFASQLPLIEQVKVYQQLLSNIHAASIALSCANKLGTQTREEPSKCVEGNEAITVNAKNSSLSSENNGIQTSSIKSAMSLERVLEEHLKGPVLSVAQLLLLESRRADQREKELLLAQMELVKKENSVLRAALLTARAFSGANENALAKTSLC